MPSATGSAASKSCRASQIEAIAETVPHVTIPFELTTPWYLIVELTDTLAGVDLDEPLATVLSDAMEAGLADDVILASNLAQAKAIWAVRHSVSEGNKRSGYVVSHDSVVPLERQAAFVTNVEARIMAAVPHARVVMHGHIGDGNIHVIALIDRAHCQDPARRPRWWRKSTRSSTTRPRRRAGRSVPSTASGSPIAAGSPASPIRSISS